jgi:hypothetical protein
MKRKNGDITNEIKRDERKKRNQFITRLEEVLNMLSKDMRRISYRKAGRELGVDSHKILNDEEFRDLVDKANEKIENMRRN